MSSDVLPPIGVVRTVSKTGRENILDRLFEPSDGLRSLCEHLLQESSFDSYDSMIAKIQDKLKYLLDSPREDDTQTLDAILRSHPRLGEKKIESKQSQAEQAQLASSDMSDEEKLAKMNAAYEQTFPGLRYVVFVDGRSRLEILSNMEARIDQADIQSERERAIKAMCEIASDRAHKSGR
ncbi:MAG: hypothetical protein Q9164_000950 [Protoblastenia rupestris]